MRAAVRRYISLYLEGGLTLVFPTSVAHGAAVASRSIVAGGMRYQMGRSVWLTTSLCCRSPWSSPHPHPHPHPHLRSGLGRSTAHSHRSSSRRSSRATPRCSRPTSRTNPAAPRDPTAPWRELRRLVHVQSARPTAKSRRGAQCGREESRYEWSERGGCRAAACSLVLTTSRSVQRSHTSHNMYMYMYMYM